MKYRLIREYPGSPKLGTILTHEELQYCIWNEYYQEVVEKDYEILLISLHRSDKPKITNMIGCGNDYILSLLNCNGNKIHSVKRLSDSEIFTIGDKVFSEYVNYTINKIGIVNDKCMVSALYDTNNPNDSRLHYNLNNLKKLKQPLFTTEDGVDIFENNTSIYILDKFTIRHIKHKDFNVISKHVKYFSTKEKAEEYILLNKPCLSLNDIFKNVEEMRKGLKTFENSQLAKRFKKLVQQKLNNKN